MNEKDEEEIGRARHKQHRPRAKLVQSGASTYRTGRPGPEDWEPNSQECLEFRTLILISVSPDTHTHTHIPTLALGSDLDLLM